MESRTANEARGALATTEPERPAEAVRASGAMVRSATTEAGAGDGTETVDGTEVGVVTCPRDAVIVVALERKRPCPRGETANATTIAETPAPAMTRGRRRIGARSSRTSSHAEGRSPSPERILAKTSSSK